MFVKDIKEKLMEPGKMIKLMRDYKYVELHYYCFKDKCVRDSGCFGKQKIMPVCVSTVGDDDLFSDEEEPKGNQW